MFLRKSRRILRTGVRLLNKKGDRLIERDRIEFEKDLRALDQAILEKQKKEAVDLTKDLKSFIKTHFPKTPFDHIKEVGYALCFAIVVAFVIRQFWFELYEVPTGSMRPTVEELDRMVVSKTTFGMHLPFYNKPLFFTDDLIKRAGIIVFTVKDMDVPDSDMLYFNLIPGKKRYVKRALAKPGDTVYFYGGYLYGIDKNGDEIIELADPSYLQRYGIEKIDHIPYITFDGRMDVGRSISPNVYDSTTIKQMNRPVGKIRLTRNGTMESTFFNGKEWVKDLPNALKKPHEKPMSYSDLWGIGNYAMARILTKEQAQKFFTKVPETRSDDLYLELKHTPNLTFPKPEMRHDGKGRIHPMLTPQSTLIPLESSHLETIQKALITARFHVKDGYAFRYQEGNTSYQRLEYSPKFQGVPNGLYEFYYGIGYKVHLGGIRTELPKDHPLYSSNPDNIRKLFNLGMGFNRVFEPTAPNQPYNPQRFAYYRNGDLYVMGAPLFKERDPVLMHFIQEELDRQETSSREAPYIAFIDRGPPLKEGRIDHEFIRAFGLKIPDGGILALGDNYAMSADSRDFGFVPVENLRGAPSFSFWPPSKRLGSFPQPPYPWVTPANLIVWGTVLVVVILCWIYVRKRNRTSYFDS